MRHGVIGPSKLVDGVNNLTNGLDDAADFHPGYLVP